MEGAKRVENKAMLVRFNIFNSSVDCELSKRIEQEEIKVQYSERKNLNF